MLGRRRNRRHSFDRGPQLGVPGQPALVRRWAYSQTIEIESLFRNFNRCTQRLAKSKSREVEGYTHIAPLDSMIENRMDEGEFARSLSRNTLCMLGSRYPRECARP